MNLIYLKLHLINVFLNRTATALATHDLCSDIYHGALDKDMYFDISNIYLTILQLFYILTLKKNGANLYFVCQKR